MRMKSSSGRPWRVASLGGPSVLHRFTGPSSSRRRFPAPALPSPDMARLGFCVWPDGPQITHSVWPPGVFCHWAHVWVPCTYILARSGALFCISCQQIPTRAGGTHSLIWFVQVTSILRDKHLGVWNMEYASGIWNTNTLWNMQYASDKEIPLPPGACNRDTSTCIRAKACGRG